MTHPELVKHVSIRGRQVRDGVFTKDEPLKHRLVNDATSNFFVGAKRLHFCILNCRCYHVLVNGVEIDRSSVMICLSAEWHQHEAEGQKHAGPPVTKYFI